MTFGLEGGGSANISLVDNTFRQSTPTITPPGGNAVPLPPAVWTGLTTLSLMGAVMLKRKGRVVFGL